MNLKRVFLCIVVALSFSACNGIPSPQPDSEQSSDDTVAEEEMLRVAILVRASEWLSVEDGGILDEGVPYSQETREYVVL